MSGKPVPGSPADAVLAAGAVLAADAVLAAGAVLAADAWQGPRFGRAILGLAPSQPYVKDKDAFISEVATDVIETSAIRCSLILF